MIRLALLDRDGVLSPDTGYPWRLRDAVLFPDVVPALSALQAMAVRLAVVSNQSGVARGLFSLRDVEAFNRTLVAQLAAGGVTIGLGDFFVCPHGPDDGCTCRKPRPGLLHSAMKRFGVCPDDSLVVGDRERDVEAGRAAGTYTILLNRGAEPSETTADFVISSLADIVDIVRHAGPRRARVTVPGT